MSITSLIYFTWLSRGRDFFKTATGFMQKIATCITILSRTGLLPPLRRTMQEYIKNIMYIYVCGVDKEP